MDTGESAKRAVRVTIFNQAYTVRTAGDAADTEALAAGVDELMHRIADRAHLDDASRVAVLAALHMADKLRGLERRAKELEARVEELKQQSEKAESRAGQLLEQAHPGDQPTMALQLRSELRERLIALEERLASLMVDTDNRS